MHALIGHNDDVRAERMTAADLKPIDPEMVRDVLLVAERVTPPGSTWDEERRKRLHLPLSRRRLHGSEQTANFC